MNFEPFCRWADATPVAEGIRDSRFIFPIIETFHLFALTVLLGSIVILSLRLMGAGFRSQTVAQVARTLTPLTLFSLLTMLATGFLLFTSEAIKCFESPPFWAKMELLSWAILFHYTFVTWTARSESAGRVRGSVAAVVSLCLWFGVGMAGRAIGFY